MTPRTRRKGSAAPDPLSSDVGRPETTQETADGLAPLFIQMF